MSAHAECRVASAAADPRAEFERVHGEVDRLVEADPESAAQRLATLSHALRTATHSSRRHLVQPDAGGKDAARGADSWISRRHEAIVATSIALAPALADSAPLLAEQVIAIGLFHWGEGVKSGGRCAPQDHVPLHELYRRAVDGRAVVGGIPHADSAPLSLEALYLRALLLARFAAGVLDRSQAEILDAWICRWSDVLRAESTWPDAPALRVDLDRAAGLCDGRRGDDGPSLYLRLEPLEARRREVIKDLQRGRSVAGAAAGMDDQIAVLDHMRDGFAAVRGEPAQRAERSWDNALPVEVCVGLAQILAQAGIETEPDVRRNPDHVACGPDRRAQPRPMRVVNSSASGFALEAQESDAGWIGIGELIAWKQPGDVALTVARVARRLPGSTAGRVCLGARLLTQSAVPIVLCRRRAEGQLQRKLLCIPGDDDSGRRDGFLFPSWGFEPQAKYQARIGACDFTIRFNRVRAQGPGWILGGFEIVLPQGDGEDASSLDLVPTFGEQPLPTLALDDTWGDDVWQRELSPRLLK